MNNIKLISSLVALADRLENSGHERTANLITSLLDRSYRYAVDGFMDNIQSQDPFVHFAQWPKTNLSDPREALKKDIMGFVKVDGEQDAEDIRALWASKLNQYVHRCKTAVESDASPEATDRQVLLGKVVDQCKTILGALKDLNDAQPVKSGESALQAIDGLTTSSEPADVTTDTPEAVKEPEVVQSPAPTDEAGASPEANTAIPEVTPNPGTQRGRKPKPKPVTNVADSPEAPDEDEGIFGSDAPVDVPKPDVTNANTGVPEAPAAPVATPDAPEAPESPEAPEATDAPEVPEGLVNDEPLPKQGAQRAPKVPHISDSHITESVRNEVLRTFDAKISGYEDRKSSIEDGFHRMFSVMSGPAEWKDKAPELQQQFEQLSQKSLNRTSAQYMAKHLSWPALDRTFSELISTGDQTKVRAFVEDVRGKVMIACDDRIKSARKMLHELQKDAKSGNDQPFLELINHPKQSKLRARVISKLTDEGLWDSGDTTEDHAVDDAQGSGPIADETVIPEAPAPAQQQQTPPQQTPPLQTTEQVHSFLASLYQVFGVPGHVTEHIVMRVLGMSSNGSLGLHYIDALQKDLSGTQAKDKDGMPVTHTSVYIRRQLEAMRTRYIHALSAVKELRGQQYTDQDVVNKAWAYLQSEVDPVLSDLENHGFDMPVEMQAAQLDHMLTDSRDQILNNYPEGPMRDEATRRLQSFQDSYNKAADEGRVPKPASAVNGTPTDNAGAGSPTGNATAIGAPAPGANVNAPSVPPVITPPPVVPPPVINPSINQPVPQPQAGGHLSAPPRPVTAPPVQRPSGSSGFAQGTPNKSNAPQAMDDETRKYMSYMMSAMLGFQVGSSIHHGLDHAAGLLNTTAETAYRRQAYAAMVPQIGISEVAALMIEDNMSNEEILGIVQAYTV